MRNQKGISLIAIIIIVVIVIGIIIYIANYKDGHKLTNEEKTAYLNFRSEITKIMNALEYSSKDNSNFTGTISKKDFELLGQMVKSEDKNNYWFSNPNSKEWVFGAYNTEDILIEKGYTPEEAKEYEITYIFDSNFIYTLYVRRIGTDYYLFDYEFSGNNTEQIGALITIK